VEQNGTEEGKKKEHKVSSWLYFDFLGFLNNKTLPLQYLKNTIQTLSPGRNSGIGELCQLYNFIEKCLVQWVNNTT
jgi:hypothetical protein